MELIYLIRRMSMENTTWGAPMIASELALLGFEMADWTVAKYMVMVRTPDPSQRWGISRVGPIRAPTPVRGQSAA